jgi:hypothetical protein
MYDTVDRREISNTRKVAAAFGLALVFALRCAHGQGLQAAQACTRLGDDAARLSCYDTVMGKSGPASAAKPPAAPPTAASLPKDLSAQVRKVTPLAAGLYRLVLDNGQVWDTTQASSALTFKANDAVTITRGSLDSHQISLAGHSTGVSVIRKQ